MKSKHYLIITLSVFITLSLCAAVQAEVYRLYFNAYTTNYPDFQRMDFWVDVSDTMLRTPDAIGFLVVVAPDGTIFDMTDNTWIEFDGGFWFGAKGEDFNSEVIPSGRYYAGVWDLWGNPIINYDDVQVNFLDVPVITYPTEGSTVGSLTPTITWTAVPGAERYRLSLWKWGCERVYPRGYIYTYKPYFEIQKGVLRPATGYRVQIEAHDSDKDRENRSRSIDVNFSTP
jgi:hypothetical protein